MAFGPVRQVVKRQILTLVIVIVGVGEQITADYYRAVIVILNLSIPCLVGM